MDELPSLVADVNARIREIAERSAERASDWEFMCECGCGERVRLGLEEYEGLLAKGLPVVVPGHRPSATARARALQEDAAALRAQAEHQVGRALKGRKPRT